ncbi:MAPEG family protein [Henriciella mobilis]|uniref:Glutathione S-transferase n=1 Tax=Henriciella mobilis TaxID=2305467 RepID=A0A399RHU2_9PROT|nr:MAPEG family protein [Henriciella mobilis]RIJ17402.1 glutathione S-transferase [Henriciella mobilis]RIJ25609.1 glutathione S-transferase [Henriciella mobilis]RIJ29395.1 glutathione S-transferase [Henriciella mobilis]
MTAIEAAVLYTALCLLLMLALKMNVGRVRAKEKVMFGDGGKEPVQRAQRVQGNAVEDVPVTLVGLVGLALLSAPVWLVHALGATLFLARVLHAVGLGGSSGGSPGRMWGTLLSLVVMLATVIACLWYVVV